MGYNPQESKERNRYHGYTVKGTPDWKLILTHQHPKGRVARCESKRCLRLRWGLSSRSAESSWSRGRLAPPEISFTRWQGKYNSIYYHVKWCNCTCIWLVLQKMSRSILNFTWVIASFTARTANYALRVKEIAWYRSQGIVGCTPNNLPLWEIPIYKPYIYIVGIYGL